MTTEPSPDGFDEFKAKYPEYFPADTPIEKQYKVYTGILATRKLQQERDVEYMQKLDRDVEAANKIREKEKLKEKAISILSNGKPIEFLMNSFRLNHAGHEEIARAVIYSTVLQSSTTTRGVQPSITGSKGAGKSSAINSVVNLFPQPYVSNSSFSPKALYYNPPIEKSIIYIDDIVLNEELVSLIKRCMTNFQTETRHKTIIDKKGTELVIPKRLVFIGTSVWEVGDDQLKDRSLNVGIINEKKDDDEYYKFERARREEGRPEIVVNEDVLLCRAMLEHIKSLEFVVKMIPNIKFRYLTDRRLLNEFYDLVEASAILNYKQRNSKFDGGVITVEANQLDVEAALEFTIFRHADEKPEGRLTKAELAFDQKIQNEVLKRNGLTKDDLQRGNKKVPTGLSFYFKESEIMEIQGKSLRACRATLYGKDGSQNNIVGGLFEKCSWYSFLEDDHGTRSIGVRYHGNEDGSTLGSAFAYVEGGV